MIAFSSVLVPLDMVRKGLAFKMLDLQNTSVRVSKED